MPFVIQSDVWCRISSFLTYRELMLGLRPCCKAFSLIPLSADQMSMSLTHHSSMILSNETEFKRLLTWPLYQTVLEEYLCLLLEKNSSPLADADGFFDEFYYPFVLNWIPQSEVFLSTVPIALRKFVKVVADSSLAGAEADLLITLIHGFIHSVLHWSQSQGEDSTVADCRSLQLQAFNWLLDELCKCSVNGPSQIFPVVVSQFVLKFSTTRNACAPEFLQAILDHPSIINKRWLESDDTRKRCSFVFRVGVKGLHEKCQVLLKWSWNKEICPRQRLFTEACSLGEEYIRFLLFPNELDDDFKVFLGAFDPFLALEILSEYGFERTFCQVLSKYPIKNCSPTLITNVSIHGWMEPLVNHLIPAYNCNVDSDEYYRPLFVLVSQEDDEDVKVFKLLIDQLKPPERVIESLLHLSTHGKRQLLESYLYK